MIAHMLGRILEQFGVLSRPRYRAVTKAFTHRVVLMEPVVGAICKCLAKEISIGHEGIAFLAGHTDGTSTIIVAAIRPVAHTTEGSFDVSAPAMAAIVRKVNDLGLQLVGQVHSHPGEAYHSDGDEIGARIAYAGFVSIVVPDYGRLLPSLERMAAYFFDAGRFHELAADAIIIVPEHLA